MLILVHFNVGEQGRALILYTLGAYIWSVKLDRPGLRLGGPGSKNADAEYLFVTSASPLCKPSYLIGIFPLETAFIGVVNVEIISDTKNCEIQGCKD